MREEKIMILSMLEEGKITSEEAIELMEALEINEERNFIDANNFEEKFSEFNESIKKQGKKVESFGANLGNTISKLINNIVDKSTSINLSQEYETFHTKLEKNIGDIENPIIELESINGSINVRKWDRNSLFIDIECKYKDKSIDNIEDFYSFYEDGNKLSLVPIYSNNIMIKLDVNLPNKCYDKIKLKTSNGRIQIEGFTLENLLCNTNNGSISASDICSDNTELLTQNGRIFMERIACPSIMAKSTNARITAENITGENLTLSTVNGRIILSNIDSNIITGSTSNGSIEIEGVNSKKIKLDTSNGKIRCKYIEIEKIDELNLSTSNSNIDVDINNIKKMSYFDLETSLGNINLEIPDLTYKINNQRKLGNRRIIAHSIDFNEGEDHFVLKASTSNGSIIIK